VGLKWDSAWGDAFRTGENGRRQHDPGPQHVGRLMIPKTKAAISRTEVSVVSRSMMMPMPKRAISRTQRMYQKDAPETSPDAPGKSPFAPWSVPHPSFSLADLSPHAFA
jgi:hypothetical protein